MLNFDIIITALDGKKKAIDLEIQSIIASLGTVEDHHVLDHALATLSQLSRSLQPHVRKWNEEECSDFVVKDHFAPSQKNEKQLVFVRTTASAGRKKKNNSLQ